MPTREFGGFVLWSQVSYKQLSSAFPNVRMMWLTIGDIHTETKQSKAKQTKKNERFWSKSFITVLLFLVRSCCHCYSNLEALQSKASFQQQSQQQKRIMTIFNAVTQQSNQIQNKSWNNKHAPEITYRFFSSKLSLTRFSFSGCDFLSIDV